MNISRTQVSICVLLIMAFLLSACGRGNLTGAESDSSMEASEIDESLSEISQIFEESNINLSEEETLSQSVDLEPLKKDSLWADCWQGQKWMYTFSGVGGIDTELFIDPAYYAGKYIHYQVACTGEGIVTDYYYQNRLEATNYLECGNTTVEWNNVFVLKANPPDDYLLYPAIIEITAMADEDIIGYAVVNLFVEDRLWTGETLVQHLFVEEEAALSNAEKEVIIQQVFRGYEEEFGYEITEWIPPEEEESIESPP